MNKLLERLRQGLRSFGRGTFDRRVSSPASRAVDVRERDCRMRTELDSHPSSLDKRPLQSTPRPTPQISRARKAVLSKARRTTGPQNAPSIWGLAPTQRASVFDAAEAPAPVPLLAGSNLSPSARHPDSGQRRPPPGPLEGAIPFGPSAEAARAPSPVGSVHPFALDDEPADRLF